MLDIKLIRNNKEILTKKLIQRGVNFEIALHQTNTLIDIDNSLREVKNKIQSYLTEKNMLGKKVYLPSKQIDCEVKNRINEITNEEKLLKQELIILEDKFQRIMDYLPNILDDDVPTNQNECEDFIKNILPRLSKDEISHSLCENGVCVKKSVDTELKEIDLTHDEIGLKYGLDFESAANISGSRFCYLTGKIAKLERALGQWMLDENTSLYGGYNEVSPPLLVNQDTIYGTGQLPKFEQDLFKTTDGRYLIPTSEVSLTAFIKNKLFSSKEVETLPLRLTALTPCFRSEAGSAGRDTKGLIRQHQFNKVELVSITTQEQSNDELKRMTSRVEHLLTALDLPWRKILLSGHDTGFSAKKTYDFEVWFPGQKKWIEVSSCSNCGDFQARRLNGKYKTTDGNKFLHTLNGSGLPTGRILAAILENYYENNNVNIPLPLIPYINQKIL